MTETDELVAFSFRLPVLSWQHQKCAAVEVIRGELLASSFSQHIDLRCTASIHGLHDCGLKKHCVSITSCKDSIPDRSVAT